MVFTATTLGYGILNIPSTNNVPQQILSILLPSPFPSPGTYPSILLSMVGIWAGPASSSSSSGAGAKLLVGVPSTLTGTPVAANISTVDLAPSVNPATEGGAQYHVLEGSVLSVGLTVGLMSSLVPGAVLAVWLESTGVDLIGIQLQLQVRSEVVLSSASLFGDPRFYIDFVDLGIVHSAV